jgi:hypothetical protein
MDLSGSRGDLRRCQSTTCAPGSRLCYRFEAVEAVEARYEVQF